MKKNLSKSERILDRHSNVSGIKIIASVVFLDDRDAGPLGAVSRSCRSLGLAREAELEPCSLGM